LTGQATEKVGDATGDATGNDNLRGDGAADQAKAKAREADVDVGSIVDTSTSPRVLAAAALAGVGLVALVLYRRSRRQNVPQVVAHTRRAAEKLARSSRR
ncbi:hypothetical protein A2J03_03705, partial [Rhodococcus sp. EPR-157]|uniref:CsbD family protein n=1 Tax=Rhodococcus sp. EPR-157 TaxID=1813677 RepID=UPI0007BAEBC9